MSSASSFVSVKCFALLFISIHLKFIVYIGFCVIITHKHTKKKSRAQIRFFLFSLCTTYCCVPYLKFICIIRRKRKKNLCYAYHSFPFHSVIIFFLYFFTYKGFVLFFSRHRCDDQTIFELTKKQKFSIPSICA